MIYGAGCRENDAVGRVVAAHETKQIAALQRPDPLGLTHDCLSERMRIPQCRRKVVMYDVAGSVKDILDFLADNILLFLEFAAVEQRLGRDVSENIKTKFEVLIEDTRIEASILPRRKSVQGAAKSLQRLGDLLGAATTRPLETHVLDKMRDAILARRFLTAANVNPDADRNRFYVRHLLTYNTQPVTEHGATIWRRQLTAPSAAIKSSAVAVATTRATTTVATAGTLALRFHAFRSRQQRLFRQTDFAIRFNGEHFDLDDIAESDFVFDSLDTVIGNFRHVK